MLAFGFGHPFYLVGLLAPVALLVWVWTRQGRRLVLPYDHALGGRGTALRIVLHGAESIPALLLAVAVLLLAGPQQVQAPITRREMTNIQFCVDVSGSMTADFGAGSRYDGAMESINDFIDYRDGDAFGLTFFGNAVLHWVPLTTDTSAFRCAPPFMDPSRRGRPSWFGGTSIGRALLACRSVLVDREKGDRMIILISDGRSSDLYGGNAQDVAEKLRADGIVVYGIHVASGGVPDEVVDICIFTGGDVFAASDPQALDTVFQRIDEMQVADLEKIASEPVDAFGPFLWTGLGLLALHLLLQLLVRFTPW